MKIIYIHSKKYGTKECLVDDEDFEYLSQFTWEIAKRNTKFYAQNSAYIDGVHKHKYMHRLIMNATDRNIHIDHRKGDGMDNQKRNLRFCTNQQNMCNRLPKRNSTSKYLGVSLSINRRSHTLNNGKVKIYQYKKWVAQIKNNQVQNFIGLFKNEEDAARAYDAKAKELHGEFANLNFPNE